MVATMRGASSLLVLAAQIGQSFAAGGVVGPGALTVGGGGRRRGGGGWSVVSNWMKAFTIDGSSLAGMNGLFERMEPDHTLPHQAQVQYLNRVSDWMLVAEATAAPSAAPGHVDSTGGAIVGANDPPPTPRPQWLLVDSVGSERFRSPGGQYLPNCCSAWWHSKHRDRLRSERVKRGDRAVTRIDLEGFWKAAETGVVREVAADEAGRSHSATRGHHSAGADRTPPIGWVRDRDQKLYHVQGWRLEKLHPLGTAAAAAAAAGGESTSGSDGRSSNRRSVETSAGEEADLPDLDELPWQIVGMQDEARIAALREEYAQHAAAAAAAAQGAARDRARLFLEEIGTAGDPIGAARTSFEDALALLDGQHPLAKAAVAASAAALATRSSSSSSASSGLPGCPAADAVRRLERVLLLHREFDPDAAGLTPGATLLDWLIRAHVRARRCVGHPNVAPVWGNFTIGSKVTFRRTESGFWVAGEFATVIGLGRASQPLATRHDVSLKRLDVSEGHVLKVVPSSSSTNNPMLEKETAVSIALKFFGLHGDVEEHTGVASMPAVPPDKGVKSGGAIQFPKGDYYAMLGVSPMFTHAALRKRFRKASLLLHPDRGGSPAAFAAMVEANAVLSDPSKRDEYDRGADVHTEQPWPIADEIERFYFPTRRTIRPFGNPYERRNRDTKYARFQEKKIKQAERRRATMVSGGVVEGEMCTDQ